jgi:glyoxylase-like metal-dependent hydrolase (beta-lactamase superfamily II)
MSRNPLKNAKQQLVLALMAAILFAAPVVLAQGRDSQKPKESAENVHVFPVRGNVYMLVGAGSNITVQVGERYIIVVDTGLTQYADEVIATIRKLSDLPIFFVVNTSSDRDHVGGNTKISHAGWALPNATQGMAREEEKDASRLVLPCCAPIVSSLNAVETLEDPSGKMAAITFGSEGFKLYNGQPVVFYNKANAHIDGDVIVFFRSADVISAGDIFSTTSYPVIESDKGGSIDGVINALNDLVEMLVPKESEEGGTYVIPGHGHLSDRNDVVNYRDMVTIIRARIEDMVKQGMTLDKVKASKPTLDYDGVYGVESGVKFTEAIYRDLTKPKTDQSRK